MLVELVNVVTVLQQLGHLALAVVQAGAYIFRSGCGLSLYLQLYQMRRSDLLEEYHGYKHKMDGYKLTVYTTWQLSFDRLRTHATQATTVLQQCAFLHHNGISQAIFQNAAVNIDVPLANLELKCSYICTQWGEKQVELMSNTQMTPSMLPMSTTSFRLYAIPSFTRRLPSLP